jgi:hypothetical protein
MAGQMLQSIKQSFVRPAFISQHFRNKTIQNYPLSLQRNCNSYCQDMLSFVPLCRSYSKISIYQKYFAFLMMLGIKLSSKLAGQFIYSMQIVLLSKAHETPCFTKNNERSIP